MFRLACIIVLLMTTGCGLLPANPEVEPPYSILYSQFLKDAAHYNRELDLSGLVIESGIPDSSPTVKGACTGDKHVIILRAYWDAITLYGKETLLYHELGHCLLGQDHRPGSIMASPMLQAWAVQQHEAFYLEELFTHAGP